MFSFLNTYNLKIIPLIKPKVANQQQQQKTPYENPPKKYFRTISQCINCTQALDKNDNVDSNTSLNNGKIKLKYDKCTIS